MGSAVGRVMTLNDGGLVAGKSIKGFLGAWMTFWVLVKLDFWVWIESIDLYKCAFQWKIVQKFLPWHWYVEIFLSTWCFQKCYVLSWNEIFQTGCVLFLIQARFPKQPWDFSHPPWQILRCGSVLPSPLLLGWELFKVRDSYTDL